MSYHFNSPAALADGRINACDLYAFPAAPGTTPLILTVNPDAGRSSPTTFGPTRSMNSSWPATAAQARTSPSGSASPTPEQTGRQQVQVRRAEGPAARNGTTGTLLGEGRTGMVFSLSGDGPAWAGLAADPFNGDGVALGRFLQGHYTPEVFSAAPSNIFAGRDLTAIALQLPDIALGSNRIALWGRISLYGHAPQRQVSRIGQPMLPPVLQPSGRGRGRPERRSAGH
jgi:hypothetical protein